MSDWKNYPPGADHRPRGDDEKYREGWDRIFGKPSPRHPDCVAARCGEVDCGRDGPCYVQLTQEAS